MRFVILDATEVTVETAELEHIGVDVTCCSSAKRDGSDIPDEALEADVIGVWHTVRIDGAMVARFGSAVRLLVRFGVGYDNVDLEACAKMGIRVCNCPN